VASEESTDVASEESSDDSEPKSLEA
jgi:hypothetical protein